MICFPTRVSILFCKKEEKEKEKGEEKQYKAIVSCFRLSFLISVVRINTYRRLADMYCTQP